MREHITVERIQRRVVSIRGEDNLFEIVEDDDRTVPPSQRNAR
jgi:hypothetical protein